MLENSAKLFVIGFSAAWIILAVICIIMKIVYVVKGGNDNVYDDEIDDAYDDELDKQTQLDHAAAIRDDGRFV